tara:strand:- start:35 stop:1435 length:1401 start_codon:yes stop_codon:yes gene_type:complete
MNEEELSGVPSPDQGVAKPDYTLDAALYSAFGPLKGFTRAMNLVKGAIDLTKPASQRTVDVEVIDNAIPNTYKPAKTGKDFLSILKRDILDSDLGQIYKIIKRGELIMDFTAGGNNPKDKAQPKPDDFDPRGGASDDEIMQAYKEATGELDLDPFRGKTPEETTRKDIGPILSPESDLNLFQKTGRANINRIKANFTDQEIRLLKSFENHHAVPLKQSGWLVYGLPQDELGKTQFYMAQRGLKGGNVLEQIRIYPEGIHDQAHQLGERIIGQMRKRGGKSIERVLGDLEPNDYFAIKTFEGRKQYIDKFLDGITEIDNKINKVLDALYANRLNDDTALDALIDINENVDDPKSLGILDNLLEQIDAEPGFEPFDDTANIQRATQVRKEDQQLQGTLNRFLRAAIERNRQKFSKFDTFDDALDAAEQILERQGGGQRKLFYTSDGGQEYVTFAEQAERLARLLFENQ